MQASQFADILIQSKKKLLPILTTNIKTYLLLVASMLGINIPYTSGFATYQQALAYVQTNDDGVNWGNLYQNIITQLKFRKQMTQGQLDLVKQLVDMVLYFANSRKVIAHQTANVERKENMIFRPRMTYANAGSMYKQQFGFKKPLMFPHLTENYDRDTFENAGGVRSRKITSHDGPMWMTQPRMAKEEYAKEYAKGREELEINPKAMIGDDYYAVLELKAYGSTHPVGNDDPDWMN